MIWRNLRTSGRILAAALAAAALAGCAARVQPEAGASPALEARPAMWRLKDEDTTIYLFGTIHALPEGIEWRSARLDRALAEAEELVLEIADTGDQAAAARLMMELGTAEGLPPILERVPAERRDILRELVADSGIPIQAFDRMKSWAAALVLTAINFQRMGATGERGVESVIGAPWREGGRTVIGLETAEQQLGFFDQLSEEAQRAFLASVTDDPEEARRLFEAMVAAWSAGDVEAIARTFNAEESMTAELREILLTRRNARWAEWLKQRMERPGTLFVAVGAGHLAGEGSVQDMLTQRGVRSDRVQ